MLGLTKKFVGIIMASEPLAAPPVFGAVLQPVAGVCYLIFQNTL